MPVLPSDIDIHAATRLIADLLLVAKVSRRMGRLGVVANRVRENTLSHRRLGRFLDRLSIPTIGELRDSQNYIHAAEQGLGVHELQPSRARKDLRQWQSIIDWLALRLETPLTQRDLHVPKAGPQPEPANEGRFVGGAVTPLVSSRVRRGLSRGPVRQAPPVSPRADGACATHSSRTGSAGAMASLSARAWSSSGQGGDLREVKNAVGQQASFQGRADTADALQFVGRPLEPVVYRGMMLGQPAA